MAHFSVFGCWNKNVVPCNIYSPQTPMASVLRSVRKEINDFLVILGDNQYPIKLNALKKYNIPNMLSGFQCLTKIPVTKYILFGNHDTDNPNSLDTCQIVKEEISFMKKANKNGSDFRYPSFDIRNKLIMTRKIGKHLLLMIDSTIYCVQKKNSAKEENSEKKEKSVQKEKSEKSENLLEELECYKSIVPELQNISDYTELQNKLFEVQRNELQRVLEKHDKKGEIWLCMHHPVITVKEKKESIQDLTYHPELYDILFYINTFRQDNTKEFFIFSADYHLYLEAKIQLTREKETLNIHQYIIGTGGAELDSYTNPPELLRKGTIKNTTTEYQYNVVQLVDKVGYGYMNCTVSGDKLHCSFIPIDNNSSKKGSTKRRRKRSSSTKKSYSFLSFSSL